MISLCVINQLEVCIFFQQQQCPSVDLLEIISHEFEIKTSPGMKIAYLNKFLKSIPLRDICRDPKGISRK